MGAGAGRRVLRACTVKTLLPGRLGWAVSVTSTSPAVSLWEPGPAAEAGAKPGPTAGGEAVSRPATSRAAVPTATSASTRPRIDAPATGPHPAGRRSTRRTIVAVGRCSRADVHDPSAAITAKRPTLPAIARP